MSNENGMPATRVHDVVHTPGPWICHFGVMNPYKVFVDDKSNDCIAVVDSRGGLAKPSEIKANGKLMAAAPDLLAACELVELWMRGGQPGPHSDSIVLEQVKLAIQKARS